LAPLLRRQIPRASSLRALFPSSFYVGLVLFLAFFFHVDFADGFFNNSLEDRNEQQQLHGSKRTQNLSKYGQTGVRRGDM
jgi:hypothetical protein